MSYTDEELLDALREFHDKHGRSPTATEANDDDTLPHEATFRRRFGSWNAAVEKAGLTPRKPTFSDEELLDALRTFHDENGYWPTGPEVDDDDALPATNTFVSHFGSWSEALEVAGFTPRRRDRLDYSDEELLDALREFHDEYGHSPIPPEVNKNVAMPAVANYHHHFGSWSEALAEAGLPPRNHSQRDYSDEELLDHLRAFHDKHGRSPTATEVNDDDTLPSELTFERCFGSWNAAVEKAGLKPRNRQRRWSDEQLLDLLREYADEHGRPPTATEIDEDDTLPSDTTFQRRFGSWNKAIEAAGLTPRNSRQHSEDSQHANP